MMLLTTAAKRRMHRDICSDPVLHGLVLNLYLNGEQYPHRVDDYFPVASWREPELASAMKAHMRDEDKHIVMYEKAIRRLRQPVLVLPLDDVFNHVIRSHTKISFAMRIEDSEESKRMQLAHFLAHLHFLEARVARSLEFHVEACTRSPSGYPEKVVAAVLVDELRHAAYTREAVLELLPRGRALEVLALHEKAEGRANLDFSAHQLGKLVRENFRRLPASRGWFYGVCALLLQVTAHV